MVQWLRLLTSNAGHMGSSPDQGTKIPHGARRGQKIEKERERERERKQASLHVLRTCWHQMESFSLSPLKN